MNIINENSEKSKRYLPHELKTRLNAVLTYRNGNSYMGDYEPMYEGNSYYYPMHSYPIHSGRSMHSKESKRKEIIERLHEMKNEAADEQVKMVISEAIEKMNK